MQRNSILNERHRQLGSKLDGDTWNSMPIPWSYNSDPHAEVVAVRSRAALYDVSALNIINISGADAQAVLDKLVSIDVSKLKPGTARLASELNEWGALVDDIMIIRDGPDRFRVSHGSGKTPDHLATISRGRDISLEPDRDVHMLSLQGPLSREVLQPHTPVKLREMPYFHHIETTLFGVSVTISRGGYSGELGYEVGCASKHAVMLWDSILEAGRPLGVVPASWNSLDLARVEAALLFFPFDMPEGDTTPWEVNMGWTIDLDKSGDYIGKEAVLNLRGRERFKQAGMICDHPAAIEPGSAIYKGKEPVGVVTSSSYSRYLMQSLAMVHLKPQFIGLGTQLVVKGTSAECTATVVKTPFYDPLRLRTHPEKLRGNS